MRCPGFPKRPSRRAVASIEFAVLAPVLCLMVGGVFEVGAMIRAYAAVNRLAMQYAVSYADCYDSPAGVCGASGSGATLPNYVSASTIANIMPQLRVTSANPAVSMAQVAFTGATPVVTYSSGASAALTSDQQNALNTLYTSVPGAYNGQVNAVVVTVSYNYSLLVFGQMMAPIIGNSIPITYTVAQVKN